MEKDKAKEQVDRWVKKREKSAIEMIRINWMGQMKKS
jgi:hypothetical protein